MRKVWLYQRKNRPGVYVMWYGDDGRQKSKRCPNKQVAEVYKSRLQEQLNSEFYAEAVMLPWDELREAFLDNRRYVADVTAGTIISYTAVLNNFERYCGKPYSTKINHRMLEEYIAARRRAGTSTNTIAKDLRTLRTFIRWGIAKKHMGQPAKEIQWKLLRQRGEASERPALELEQFAQLLAAAENLYGIHWRIRLLLAIGTGLRLRDVERLRVEDINWERETIATANTKAHKKRLRRPLHPTIVKQLRDYIGPRSQGRILLDTFHHTKWERIRNSARMSDVTYHQLRKSFATFLADAGFSIAVVQELLEHSTPELTKSVYMDASRQHRRAAQSIPIDEALKAAKALQQHTSDAANRECPPDDSERGDRP